MSRTEQTTDGAPNPLVRELYDELGELLAQGDDVFCERGPALLQEALERDGFLDGVETEHADESYTRAKVVGDEGGHVIRYMEWPPEYALLPHEHHGRPCFEVLVDGRLAITNMDAEEVEDGRFRLSLRDSYIVHPGEAGVIDPRECEIHTVYTPVRSRSIHVYPDDAFYSVGYVRDGPDDLYRRKEFRLDD